MKKIVLALICPLLVACGGSGGSVDYEAELQACVADGTVALLSLSSVIGIIEDTIVLGASPGDGITVTPAAGVPNGWDFTIEIDADTDGVAESTATGRIVFSSDPLASPPGDGDTAQVSFVIDGDEGVGGDGNFTVAFANNLDRAIYGSASLDLRGGCDYTVTIPQATPLTFERVRVPAADVFGSEVYGVLDIEARAAGRSMETTVTLLRDDDTIRADPVRIGGEEVPAFVVDVALDAETVRRLVACSLTQVEGAIEITADILGRLVDELVGSGGAGTSVTLVDLSTWDFRIEFGGGDVATGRIRVIGLLSAGNRVETRLSFDWRDAATGSRIRTRSGDPVTIVLDLDVALRVSEGSIAGTWLGDIAEELIGGEPGGVEICQSRFVIPDNDPLFFAGELEELDFTFGGTQALETTYRNNVARSDLVFRDGDLEYASLFVNGIPLPLGAYLPD